jgi:ribonuclease HI
MVNWWQKNKMAGGPSFYAVAVGRVPGVYRTWEEAKAQVEGIKNARYKKFQSEQEAKDFVNGGASPILAQLQATTDKPVLVEEKQDPDASPHRADDLVVFTDGSALGNGRRGAKAGYAMVWPNQRHLTMAKPLEGPVKTNNRAEYMACIDALTMADRIDPSRTKTMYIYTDSMLLMNTVTKWMKSWKKNDWKKGTGEPVLNLDLVKQLDELSTGRRLVWKHVMAHTGKRDWVSHWNDVADMMAKDAAA